LEELLTMKLNHVPFSAVPVTDTDTLPDVEAMILEKSEELRQMCANAKRQVLIVVDAKGAEKGGGTFFWSLIMSKGNPLTQKEDYVRAIETLMTSVNCAVQGITEQQLGIRRIV
jgi:hypothetical protein